MVTSRARSVKPGRRATRGVVRRSAVRANQPPPEYLIKQVWPPMLATLVKTPPTEGAYAVEVKYDGYRAIAALSGGNLAVVTRNGLDLSGRFPQIARALKELTLPEAIIDGEICAFNEENVSSFQLLMTPAADERRMAFDLLWFNGKDLRSRRLEERRELLTTALSDASHSIQLAERLPSSVGDSLGIAKSRHLEGVILKKQGSHYRGGRGIDWLKLKVSKSQEVEILGYTPQSKGANQIGALLIGVWNKKGFEFAGKVGTGFSSKLRTELRERLDARRRDSSSALNAPRIRDAVWSEPQLVAQLAFTEWTPDGRLRHPAFQGLRVDKKPRDCVRETE